MPSVPVSGSKPAGKAAAAGDSSNDDPEFVGAKNEDSILGMGKDNYGRATPMTVFDKN